MFDEDFPGKKPDAIMAFYGFEPTIWLHDLDMVYDLYLSKNKYFDKHPLLHNLAEPLLGDSLLL